MFKITVFCILFVDRYKRFGRGQRVAPKVFMFKYAANYTVSRARRPWSYVCSPNHSSRKNRQ